MTITCPHCGLAFETQATTNTRCRRCRTVVRISASAPRPASPAVAETKVDALGANGPSAEEAAAAIVALTTVVVGVLVLVVPRIIEFIRRHRVYMAPTLAPDGGPVAVTGPPPELGATRARTGPNRDGVDSAE